VVCKLKREKGHGPVLDRRCICVFVFWVALLLLLLLLLEAFEVAFVLVGCATAMLTPAGVAAPLMRPSLELGGRDDICIISPDEQKYLRLGSSDVGASVLGSSCRVEQGGPDSSQGVW